jgi:hypothetical protein
VERCDLAWWTDRVSRHRGPQARSPVRRAAWRGLGWALRAALACAVAVALAPATLVAVAAMAWAWWCGCPPRRLRAAALGCLPMLAAWLSAVAVWPVRGAGTAGTGTAGAAMAGTGTGGVTAAGVTSVGSGPAGTGPGAAWFRVAAAPGRAWLSMWRLAGHGHLAAAVIAAAPPAIPLGIAAGGLAWSYRLFRMRTGAGGLTPAAPAAFDERQWRHQVRSARALLAAPGALPLLSAGGQVVAGATIRSVRHRPVRVARLPYERLRSHQVVIGSTGTGKTTLLLRLWAGFMAAGLRRYAAGTGQRPLLVVLDCKGGGSSRKVADRTRRVLRDAGARSTAIWPDEASLSLWTLPPDRLVTTLLDLIEHGTGGAAYYADVMEAVVALAVHAPCGPPASAADFLSRLDADWLATVYEASGDGGTVATVRSGKKDFSDVRLRFAALWRRLGAGLDGGASFADADAWYCVLEGTAEASVAEAQARALTDLLAFHALRGDREILLAVDEFSAVSRRVPIWRLYERARSLGLAVQVSAQSWEGLADTDDERQRIAATAEGGIWLLRTPRPEPVEALAGTRPAVDTSRRIAGEGAWSEEGLSRSTLVPVLDPDLVRRLDVGQVAYVYRGGVTYLQVKRLTGRPAAIGGGTAGGGVPEVSGAGADVAGAGGARVCWAGADGAGAEPPTAPLPVVETMAGPRPAWGPVAAAGAGPVPAAGPAGGPAAGLLGGPAAPLPDASEVLDEAFGARRA